MKNWNRDYIEMINIKRDEWGNEVLVESEEDKKWGMKRLKKWWKDFVVLCILLLGLGLWYARFVEIS